MNLEEVFNFYKGKKVLVTGHPGFKGTWLSRLLVNAGAEVTGYSLSLIHIYAVRCMTLLSCIPGIMNMSITAKTDSMTVFMQLVMLLFLLLYIRRQRSAYLVLAVDAYLMTLVLKPTALVFSTVAAGTAGLYLLLTRQMKFRLKGSFLPSCI